MPSLCWILKVPIMRIHSIPDIFSCRHENYPLSVWTLIRYVTLHCRNRRGEQKPYPLWLSCRRAGTKTIRVIVNTAYRIPSSVHVSIDQTSVTVLSSAIFSSVARFWFYFSGSVMLLKVLVFSFSRNKIGKQICNKNCSLKARACGEAVRTSPCSVISSLVLLLRDFTIIAQKESLLAGKRLLHLLAGVEYHKHVKCYNHRLFCFTVQNFVIKKRGNLLTPAANKFFLFFFPVSAFYAENFSKQISFNAHIWTKSKFLGLSVGVENIGQGNRNTFSRELQAWKILEKGNILFRKVSKSWRG